MSFYIYLDYEHSVHYINHSGDLLGYIEIVSDSNCISINDIFIYESHRGKGYGAYIIKYALDYAIKLNPKLEYCILDDMTDRSNYVEGNIYQKLGFEFVEKPTETFIENDILKWKISGPERIKKL